MKKILFILGVMLISTFGHSQEVELYKKDGKVGLIKGNTVILPPIYDHISDFKMSLAWTHKDKKIGLINKKGEVLLQPTYDEAKDFSGKPGHYLSLVKLNNKFGMIDMKGHEEIPIKYDSLQAYFAEGMAYAKLNGKWGFIDSLYKVAIPFQYEAIDTWQGFYGGVIAVKSGGKWGAINKKGAVVVPFKYDLTISNMGDLVTIKLGGKYGFYNKSGKELCSPIFDDIEMGFANRGVAWVILDGKMYSDVQMRNKFFKK
ncbi:MAG: WG repeat-containing protein [Cytophagaceae bacterium]